MFGKSADDVVAWSKTTANSFGISQTAALEAAGTFGNLLVPMGFARDEAAKMSKRMVELAADMASFNNADPSDTLEAIRSGLVGETEPLRKYGVRLSQARIEQEAFRLGLTKTQIAAKAAADGLKAAEKGLADAQRERASASKAVESANSALEQANNRVAAATDKVKAAEESVQRAYDRELDANQKLANSAERVGDAKDHLAAVQAAAKRTQEALTDAREKATRQLEDMRDAARDADLTEKR